MKKSVYVFLISVLLLIGGINILKAQEQPAPKKDTVNMDTDAKPQFYYPTEDEAAGKKGGSNTVIIVIGAVIVIGGAAYFLTKKKK